MNVGIIISIQFRIAQTMTMNVIASSENVHAISLNVMMESAYHKFGFAMVRMLQ